MIPRFKPWLDKQEIRVVFKRNHGAIQKFEKLFAAVFEAKEAISFSYGRSALWAFFKAMDIEGAEVVMPGYTCSVVAHAVSLSGNIPRFVDIDLCDYNMDLDLLPEAINQSTRAVIATHLFGNPLNIDRLEEIIASAEKRYGQKIWLIQDCAHSFGARWKNRLVCNSGDFAIFGLNISKMITSIFGGMITTNDEELALKIRTWRDDTYTKAPLQKELYRRVYFLLTLVAFCKPIYSLTYWLQEKTPFLDRLTKAFHLDDTIRFPPDYLDLLSEFEGAVGIEQLKKYRNIVLLRRRNVSWLLNNTCWPHDWVAPQVRDGATYSHFVVRVSERQEEVKKFARAGIQLGELIQYAVPDLNCYRKHDIEYANSNFASKTTINIPIHPGLKEADLHKISDIISGTC